MKPVVSTLLIVLILTALTACHSQGNSAAPTKAVPQKAADAASLCQRINEIKLLPHKNEPVNDPVFNAMSAAGDAVIPCLIRKIGDQTMMPDPRSAPKVGAVAVGDVAFFLLVDLGKADFWELHAVLPEEVQNAYKSEGIYGYFRLIDENNNRQKFQEGVKGWYERKYGRTFPKE